jgi:peptide/nickel transport system permease protein
MAAVLPLPGARTRSHGFWARLWHDKPLGAVGGAVLLAFLLVGVFAGFIAPYDFNEIAPLERMQAPSAAHWFGTDNLGRDVLSRCIYGAQLSVIIGCSAAALATLISALVGIVSG